MSSVVGHSEDRDGRVSDCVELGALRSRGQSLCPFALGGILGGMEGISLLRFELQRAGSEAGEVALKC